MKKGHHMHLKVTQERILDAAANVIAQRGYSSAGVQEIVKLSGTSKGSFYFHFPSKEKMALALVERMSNKLISKIQSSISGEKDPAERLGKSIEVLIATFSKQRKIGQVFMLNIMGHGQSTDKLFFPMREKFADAIRSELDNAVKLGRIKSQDTSLIAHIWIGALHEIILRWLLTNEPDPLTSITDSLSISLLKSVGIEKEPISQKEHSS
jgi:AcrR family transcriptional regulator